MDMSNLTDHARTELTRIGMVDDGTDDINATMTRHLLDMVAQFAEAGHSGASAEYARDLLHSLLAFKPLGPLTDDPAEWLNVSDMSGFEMWQNRRSSEAFSDDGGKTYWLLSEGAHGANREPRHESNAA
jgi:hypothetical protein